MYWLADCPCCLPCCPVPCSAGIVYGQAHVPHTRCWPSHLVQTRCWAVARITVNIMGELSVFFFLFNRSPLLTITSKRKVLLHGSIVNACPHHNAPSWERGQAQSTFRCSSRQRARRPHEQRCTRLPNWRLLTEDKRQPRRLTVTTPPAGPCEPHPPGRVWLTTGPHRPRPRPSPAREAARRRQPRLQRGGGTAPPRRPRAAHGSSGSVVLAPGAPARLPQRSRPRGLRGPPRPPSGPLGASYRQPGVLPVAGRGCRSGARRRRRRGHR